MGRKEEGKGRTESGLGRLMRMGLDLEEGEGADERDKNDGERWR